MFQNFKYSFDNQDLLSGLPDDLHKKITARKTTSYFKAGTSIFKEGDGPEGLYRILKGKVKKFCVVQL